MTRPPPRRAAPILRRAALLLACAACASGAARAADGDALLARNLAATCATCHGTDGHARGAMKPLAGVPAALTLAKLADFRSGAAPATVMHQIVKGYTEAQLRLVAGYFAAQKVRP